MGFGWLVGIHRAFSGKSRNARILVLVCGVTQDRKRTVLMGHAMVVVTGTEKRSSWRRKREFVFSHSNTHLVFQVAPVTESDHAHRNDVLVML